MWEMAAPAGGPNFHEGSKLYLVQHIT